MPKLLKKPIRLDLHGMIVWRRYEDVQCADCDFSGANHWKNFATEEHWVTKPSGKRYLIRARCHPCVRRREAAKDAAQRLFIKLYGAERKARKLKSTFVKPISSKRASASARARNKATKRRMRKVLNAAY